MGDVGVDGAGTGVLVTLGVVGGFGEDLGINIRLVVNPTGVGNFNGWGGFVSPASRCKLAAVSVSPSWSSC